MKGDCIDGSLNEDVIHILYRVMWRRKGDCHSYEESQFAILWGGFHKR